MKKLLLSRIIAVLLLITIVVLLGYSGQELYRHWLKYSHSGWIRGLRIIQIVVGTITVIIVAAIAAIQRRRFLAEVSGFAPLRSFIYCIFAAVAVTSIVSHYYLPAAQNFWVRSVFNSILFLLLSDWALLVVICSGKLTPKLSGIMRKIDLLTANLIITLLLLEASITIFARFSHSPFFWDQTSLASTIDIYRARPGSRHFNININSLGYHDQEFFQAGPKDFVVSLIGDSFAFGIVPYDYNFATIAERRLQKKLSDRFERIAIHNHGIPCIGMPEYAYLLQTEIMHDRPQVVLLSIFLGNDIGGIKKAKRKYYTLQQWWLGHLAQRIVAYYHERGKGKGNSVGESPFTLDVTKEVPTFSQDRYLEIESARVEICNTVNPNVNSMFADFFELLAWFQQILADKLVVVLVPDEVQVNDQLYQQVMRKKVMPQVYDREYPQKRIAAFCKQRGINMLDLSPALRRGHKKIRVYHLQDSHWNAHGNRIAGEEVSNFILRHYFPKLNVNDN